MAMMPEMKWPGEIFVFQRGFVFFFFFGLASPKDILTFPGLTSDDQQIGLVK